MDAGMVAEVIDAERRFFAVASNALRRLRLERGFTQVELAGTSGVDASTISEAESFSRRRVRALTLARLAEALDVAPAELLVGDTEEDTDGR